MKIKKKTWLKIIRWIAVGGWLVWCIYTQSGSFAYAKICYPVIVYLLFRDVIVGNLIESDRKMQEKNLMLQASLLKLTVIVEKIRGKLNMQDYIDEQMNSNKGK